MSIAFFEEHNNPTDKHQRIIQAATTVFARHGFYNSTVADVAREADVADGTIYLYFKNKDDLLISIFETCIDFFIQSAREEIAKGKDAIDKLARFINFHLKLVQKNQDLAQVIQIELRQSTKFMKEYANEKFFDYLSLIEEVIKEGQKKGDFRRDANPAILNRAIFGAIDEMALEWILMKNKRYTLEEAAEQISRMFIEGLKG